MANGDWRDVIAFTQPSGGSLQCRCHVGYLPTLKAAINGVYAPRGTRAEPRLRSDAVHLPLDLKAQVRRSLDGKQLELDAGRAGIDDENRIHTRHTAASTAVRRRA
jgi:hypothetical protein